MHTHTHATHIHTHSHACNTHAHTFTRMQHTCTHTHKARKYTQGSIYSHTVHIVEQIYAQIVFVMVEDGLFWSNTVTPFLGTILRDNWAR